MQKTKKRITSVVLALALVCSVGTTAFAVWTVTGENGMWDHGVQGLNVWSNYHHKYNKHYSSVKGINFVRSSVADPQKWSYASTAVNPFGGNNSWYCSVKDA